MNFGKLFILLVILSIGVSIFVSMNVNRKKPESALGIGAQFHAETSITWSSEIARIIRRLLLTQAPTYKTYPDAQIIPLPKPAYRGITVEEAMVKRRSRRNYTSKQMSLAQLSQLLFAAQGLTDGEHRTVPSAAARYPIEIYIIVNTVEGLAKGIYHYGVKKHTLEFIKPGNFKNAIITAGMEQEMLGDADVTFVLSAVFDRDYDKFRARGYRYAYLEAGLAIQNLYLEAESLGLGTVSIGHFIDKKVDELVGIDGKKEATIILQAVGTI